MLINGEKSEALPALDRGFQYGDGVFETIAVSNKSPCLWDRHWRRLTAGCRRLGIPTPDPDLLLSEARQVIGESTPGILKIILSRGSNGRGYTPPCPTLPTRLLHYTPWPDYIETLQTEGIRLRLCNARLGINPALAGIKHLNRLEQVLARGEWDDPAIHEGLMLDIEGRLVEGTMSNLFIYRSGTLFTPDLSRCGVEGVLRSLVLDLADEIGMPKQICDLSLEDAMNADAIFLTNSLIGIWPVRQLENRSFQPTAFPGRLKNLVLERYRN